MIHEATLRIPAIHCGGCVKMITGTLEALPSVKVAEADTETKLVHVQFDESAVSVDQIREALDEVGFSADD
jgi:copper chaperone